MAASVAAAWQATARDLSKVPIDSPDARLLREELIRLAAEYQRLVDDAVAHGWAMLPPLPIDDDPL